MPGGVPKLTILQAFFILTMAIGLSNHVTLIPLLLNAGDRDSWTSVPISILPLFIWIYLLYRISDSIGSHSVMEWLRTHYSRWITPLFVVPMIVYLFMVAAITLKEITTWAQLTYLPKTPIVVIVGTLLSICFYIARAGLRSLAITTGILLPLVWILGHFVAISNLEFKDYSRLLPVFTDGFRPIIQCMVYFTGSFTELFLILLLQPHMKSPLKYKSMLILSIILSALTMGPLLGAIATFGPTEAANLRYPAFEQWRLVMIGKYIAHLDFLSLYQWVSGALIRIALALILMAELFEFKRAKLKTLFIFCVSAILLVAVIVHINDMMYLRFISNYYYSGSLIVVLILTLTLLALVTIKRSSRRKGTAS